MIKKILTCVILVIFVPYTSTFDHFIDEQEVPECKTNLLINSIKEKYELTINGIDCLFYPAKNPKRLWILCNGATINHYTMWSWFWDPKESWEETAYLFLKDDQIRWYFGTEEHPRTNAYCDLITQIIEKCGLQKEQVYTIGHSMGGYAAIHFALKLGLQGVFALRPQIDWEYGTQSFSIKKLKNQWINLDELALQTKHTPLMYLQFGEFGPDKGAGTKFINALLEKKSFVLVEKTLNTSHTGYHPTKSFIETTLLFMESLSLNT